MRELCSRAEAEFRGRLEDDLEVSGALAAVFGLLREVNLLETSAELTAADAGRVLGALRSFDQILAVLDFESAAIPDEVLEMARERQRARERRDFARADSLREAIVERGYLVEDTPRGPRIRPGTA